MQFDLVDEPFWHDQGEVFAPPRAGHGAEPKAAILERYAVA
jgi:D-galactarolactone cycloisomerase